MRTLSFEVVLGCLALAGCASRRAAPEPVVQTARPHAVRYDAKEHAVSCDKTTTRLPVDPRWRPQTQSPTQQGGATLVLLREGCRAVLVVRADQLAHRGSDFDRAWGIAEEHARALPLSWSDEETQRDDIRETVLRHDRAAIVFNGLRLAYAIDQLAALTCSFFIVGQDACLDDVETSFSGMQRAPAALRMPPQQNKNDAVRYMGPSQGSPLHDVPSTVR